MARQSVAMMSQSYHPVLSYASRVQGLTKNEGSFIAQTQALTLSIRLQALFSMRHNFATAMTIFWMTCIFVVIMAVSPHFDT